MEKKKQTKKKEEKKTNMRRYEINWYITKYSAHRIGPFQHYMTAQSINKVNILDSSRMLSNILSSSVVA